MLQALAAAGGHAAVLLPRPSRPTAARRHHAVAAAAERRRRRRCCVPAATADAAGGVAQADGADARQRRSEWERLTDGKYSYKMVKALPLDVIKAELKARKTRIHPDDRLDTLASRLYGRLVEEGRALSSEEAAVVDAQLGLADLVSNPGASYDSDGGSGGLDAVAAGQAPSPAELAAHPLLGLQASLAGRFLTDHNSERLLSNAMSLQLFFLWGGTAPNGIKHTTSCVVRTAKSVWLFECGEDAQRHLVRRSSEGLAWAKLDRIFVSSLAADNLLGLPGMLCTMSAAREKGHENADMPVHLYGPPGLANYVNTMLSVSRTYLEMPVVVHEFVAHAVPPERLGEYEVVNRRARLSRTAVPPDQLNPRGYFDAELRTLLRRHTQKRKNTGIDLRAGTYPLAVPPPGDPAATGLRVEQLTWTVKADHEWLIRAGALAARRPTFGFLLQEADRAGRLYVQVARELGVAEGEDFTKLKMGLPVTTPDGTPVRPEQCVGPPKRGRRVAIIGACADSRGWAALMAGRRAADVLPPSCYGEGGLSDYCIGVAASLAAQEPACDLVVHALAPPGALGSAAAMAGAAAATLRSPEVVLWQHQAAFVDSPAGADPDFPAQAVREAAATLGSDRVSFAGCYWAYQPDRQEHADEVTSTFYSPDDSSSSGGGSSAGSSAGSAAPPAAAVSS